MASGNRELDFTEFEMLMRRKAGLTAGEVSGGELVRLFLNSDLSICSGASSVLFSRFYLVLLTTARLQRKLFAAIDLDENGSVSLEEFQTFLNC